MISDVLREAEEEIRRYMKEMPDAYKEDEEEIKKLLASMEAFRMRPGYDLPPEEKSEPSEETQETVRGLNTAFDTVAKAISSSR